MRGPEYFIEQVKLHMDHALGRPVPDAFREECERFDRELAQSELSAWYGHRRPRPCIGIGTHGHQLRMKARKHA